MPTSNADRVALIARASLICPFLVVLLAFASSRMGSPIAEAGAIAFAFAGLICGAIALIRGKQAAGTSVAVQGGIGFLISLVFVGVVLNNYLQAKSSSSATASREAQRLSEALAQFVARTTELEQRLIAASKPLAATPVLNVAAVQSSADLDSRKQNVRTFIEASQALSNHLSQAQPTIQNQLVQRGVSPDEARDASTGFADSLKPKISLLNQIREVEHQYGATLLSALDLLTAQWGHWKSSADGAPQFTDETQARLYQGFLDRLKTLEIQDVELKQALAGTNQPPASR